MTYIAIDTEDLSALVALAEAGSQFRKVTDEQRQVIDQAKDRLEGEGSEDYVYVSVGNAPWPADQPKPPDSVMCLGAPEAVNSVKAVLAAAHDAAARITAAEARAEEAALRSIEARNPGIDMEDVKRTRRAHQEMVDGGEIESSIMQQVQAEREANPLYTVMSDDYLVLREALGFYADPDTYFAIAFAFDNPCGDFADDFTEDHGGDYDRPMPGKRARAALSGVQPDDYEMVDPDEEIEYEGHKVTVTGTAEADDIVMQMYTDTRPVVRMTMGLTRDDAAEIAGDLAMAATNREHSSGDAEVIPLLAPLRERAEYSEFVHDDRCLSPNYHEGSCPLPLPDIGNPAQTDPNTWTP
jgi:hypothetical protein